MFRIIDRCANDPEMRTGLVALSFALVFGVQLHARPSLAQLRAEPADSDDAEVEGHAETHISLFRRALLPGPAGSLIETETAAPVYEYVSMRAQNIDVSGLKDGLGFEVSAWTRAWPTTSRLEQPVDGDVQTAFATLTQGRYAARLGRQQVTGGAARFSRFDGILLTSRLPAGFDASAYAGLTVLPRWDARPGYHHLGAEADNLLRDPAAAPQPERSGHWLAGGRLGYSFGAVSASASFHEQRAAGDTARRNLGLDARARGSWASLNLSTILDTDSLRLADARVWADLAARKWCSLSLEYLHTEPALWLSRQSVLSVFSSDRVDETGASASVDLNRDLRLEGAGFVSIYDAHAPGARVETSARFAADRRTLVRLGYVRLQAPRNGYHSLRASFARRLLRQTTGTVEAYAYFYDDAIRSYHSSSVYAATLTHRFAAPWELLVGGSIARTPYAGVDLQGLARLTYSFDLGGGGR